MEVRRPDGTAIAFEAAGEGPPVVLVHGLTSSRVAWDPIAERLPGTTCVRLDLRGHGASSRADAYGLVEHVGDVRAVVEALALGAPLVVGHSLGGSVAALYAAAHPVRGAVVVDQTLRFGAFARRLAPHAERLAGDDWAEAVLEIDRDLGIEVDAAFEAQVRACPPEVVRGVWEAALTVPPERLDALAEAVLPRIAAPLWALHGSPPPADYEPWLTALVPGARVETWPGTGHRPHLADPERFAARVLALAA